MALPPLDLEAARGGRNQIVQAATIVGVAFVFSRVLGVVRDAVINFYYNIDSLEANAYFIASRFPETIFYIIAGGALGSAFIPTFAAYFVREDSQGGWRLFSAIVNLVTLVTTVVAVITAWFAPQLILLFYPDLVESDPALLPMAADLLRLMLLTPTIFGISGVVMGALNARQHFLLPAVAPIIYNLGIILGAILLAPDVMGLAIGSVVGALGHLLIQLPGLTRQQGQYRPVVTLADPGVRQVLRLMAPRVLGLSFGQLNHLLIQFLAQAMVIGSIPALGFAWRIMIMPQGIIGQALGIAAFPTFSTLAARAALREMRRIFGDTMRLIAFLSLPASALLIVFRRPLVTALFERGQFDAESTEFVAWALLFYAVSLIGLAAIEIISRAFYALEDTRTPVLAGALQLGAMAGVGLWLSRWIFPALGWLPLGGLALGYTVSTFLELFLLLGLLGRKLGGIDGQHLLDGFWRMLAAGLLMTLASRLVLEQLGGFSAWVQLLVGAAAGGLTYVLAAAVLRVDELGQLWRYMRRGRGSRGAT
jgi:putative peptidoglycan lipid II flippase